MLVEAKATQQINNEQYAWGVLQFFPTSEGYVRTTDGTNKKWFDYVYNYTDHLGNIRLSYTTDPISGSTSNIKILEENNYYPFGLQHGSYNTPARDYRPIGDAREIETADRNPYKYKYNGKEWQDELGVDWYDYGWRQYDPAIGRWQAHDPLAEQYRRWSPYNYAVNNPIRFIDPDGMAVDDVIITGDKAKETLKQLNASTSLRLKMDDNGKVTAKGNAKTDADKKLLEAINDGNVVVQIDGTSSNFTKSGNWFVGGAYGGSEVKEDGKTYTTQTVNPEMTTAIDKFYGAAEGSTVMHEVIESYIGGVDSPGVGAPTFDSSTLEFKAYEIAHNKADVVDPRHVAPTLTQDQNTGHIYINKPHPVLPRLNVEKLINDLSK